MFPFHVMGCLELSGSKKLKAASYKKCILSFAPVGNLHEVTGQTGTDPAGKVRLLTFTTGKVPLSFPLFHVPQSQYKDPHCIAT